jgi:dimethylamine/trimethylamine dehydrogenase
MGSLLAEKLALAGHAVTLISSESRIAPWTQYTQEQEAVLARLSKLNVACRFNLLPTGYAGGRLELACRLSGRSEIIAAPTLVPVTSRLPNRDLHDALAARLAAGTAGGIKSLHLIGDAEAPATIAHAVYAGHRLAHDLESGESRARRDRVVIGG